MDASSDQLREVQLTRWSTWDFLRQLDNVLAVYGAAMRYSTAVMEPRRGFLAAHAQRRGFRAVASIADNHLIGFGYGYRSAPGQWWHDQVATAIAGSGRRGWLDDCFELAELHVTPAAQGHGVGYTQLQALLAEVPQRTVLLSTPELDSHVMVPLPAGMSVEASLGAPVAPTPLGARAWRLYRRLGFVDVARNFLFAGDDRRFAILGRQLPLSP